MHCPLDCQYLQEARKHEEPPIADEAEFPNQDIRITENFLRENEGPLLFLSVSLLQASLEIPNVVDSDAGEALDGLIRTYRTLQSGLYYQSRPENPIAGAVYDRMQSSVHEMRAALAKDTTARPTRDAEILGVFAFLQRLEIQHRNGRRLGRSFIDFLREYFPKTLEGPEPSSSLIV